MWLKIEKLALPISLKLAIIYTIILFLILLFTSLLTIAGVDYYLYVQAESDIRISANNVTHYLAAGHPLDQYLFKENILEPDIIFRVFDDQDNLLLDNSPYTPGNNQVMKQEVVDINFLKAILLKKKILRIIELDHTHYYFLSQEVYQDNHSYQMQFMQAMSDETLFLQTLTKMLIVTNLLGLLIAIISGIFMSRKMLRPIREITSAANDIQINDLGKRIPVSVSNDELQQLATTFNHMLDRLEIGFEQQRRFAADASHELRTPITVISGYANMLDRWGKQDISVLEEGIDAIKSEAANMYNLIEQLLFLVRADQSKQTMNKANLDVQKIIDEVVQETCLIASNHHILLTQNDTVSLYADASSIKQMLRIFIENSIKYTPINGTIIIASRETSKHLEITIQDTGIGIPAEEQRKIFDRFYRVDKSRSKMTGGTGLGLAIAQWIAKQHNITIELTSTPGEGTIITLKIPLPSVTI